MFREMKRKKQHLSKFECEEILRTGSNGVLAVSGDDGYPYAVPLSYVYSNGSIYFHCGKTGHKIDAVEHCDKASFCVVSMDDIQPKKYTTYYKSVIAFGRIKVLKSIDEMKEPITALAQKYIKNDDNGISEEFERFKNAMYMLELEIEHITGKQGKDLADGGAV